MAKFFLENRIKLSRKVLSARDFGTSSRIGFILSVNFQWWHGVDGGLFEGIDGSGVFLGVGEAAVSEDAGYGRDVGSVAQQVGAAAVTGAMLGDVFLDAGASYPVPQGFQTHGVAREWEDNLITVVVFRLSYECQKSVIEGNDNSTCRAMSFGLALLELQQLV